MAAARKTMRRTAPSKTRRQEQGCQANTYRRHAALSSRSPLHRQACPSEPPGFLIVGIGASAGGLEAMEEFFRHMPPSSGMGFVVVSHQHAGHVSLLPSLLSKCTAMPVVEATDGVEVEPNCVYLAPGGTNMAILHGTLHLMEPHSQERVPLPIDYFFRSLAGDQKQRAIGIILSGTGTDGTLGLRAIKAESGMTIAQDPQSAKYQGMPRSAITAGVVDVVQPASQMSEPLRAYARSLTRPAPPLPEHDASQTLQKIFILLRDRTGNDFALYKENTIHRRIERRMNVHQIENLRQYLRFVLANPHELDALFQELLIGVTSFFRDPQAFEVLEQKVLPVSRGGQARERDPAPVGRRLFHRRGSLFARDPVSGVPDTAEAPPHRADFCVGPGQPGHRGGARRPLPDRHRRRHRPGAPAAVLYQGRQQLPGQEGDSGSGGVRDA